MVSQGSGQNLLMLGMAVGELVAEPLVDLKKMGGRVRFQKRVADFERVGLPENGGRKISPFEFSGVSLQQGSDCSGPWRSYGSSF